MRVRGRVRDAEDTRVSDGRANFYDQMTANKVRTVLLMTVFALLVLLVGYVAGRMAGIGWWGLAIAGAVALAMSWGSYWWSDSIVLAMSGARPADAAAGPRDAYIINTVDGLAIAAGLPAPKAYIVEDPAPNAFATGRDPAHAAVAVTAGLLDKLDRAELEGVIAHELAHVANRDTLVTTLAAVLAGTVVLLSDFMRGWFRFGFFFGGGDDDSDSDSGGGGSAVWLLIGLALAVLAPLAALLIQMAVSRKREYLADANGALLNRNPDALASALRKIASDPTPLRAANKATASLWIYNPLKDHKGAMNAMFETHPPIDERIRRLEAM
jgi:heat shock protein HtpX